MTPTFAVVVPPQPLVSIADARAFGVPVAVPDASVQGFIDAAMGFLDGPEGTFNRSFGLQTLSATLPGGFSPGRAGPVELAAGPAIGIVSVTGLSGGDSFGSPSYTLSGDMVRLFQPCGPTFGGPPPAPVVITYTAGSTAGVQALVKPVILTMVCKQIAEAASSGRDPALRSESIPDTFSRSYGATAGPGGTGAFGGVTLSPIQHLRRW